MAVISFDLPATASWPSTSRCRLAQAETRVQRLAALGPGMAAARGLAVDGDDVRLGLAQASTQATKQRLEQRRVEGVDDVAQRVVARDAVAVGQEAAQESQVLPAPEPRLDEIVRARQGGGQHQEQDLRQRIEHLPGLARVLQRREMSSKEMPDPVPVMIASFGSRGRCDRRFLGRVISTTILARIPRLRGEGLVERRLVAMMAADMAGYSRLIAEDEFGNDRAAQSLSPGGDRSKRGEPRRPRRQGDRRRLLAEFSSVVAAVLCAVELQKAIAERERTSPANRRFRYRMGINLGDVVVEGGDIFGDGVNVAARLEQLCDPGGLCVSDAVYRNVKSKLDLRFEGLGLKTFTNMPDAIQVFRLQWDDAAPGEPEAMPIKDAPRLPAKPSIAVLPFTTEPPPRAGLLRGRQTEDLITALSRVRELFIISRHSSFVYKKRTVRLEDVARELGVGFVLEGSVRVAGNKVRVTAQLIDGISGAHVWAERFDGGLDDIFSVQDDITRSIAVALQVKLTYGETARLWEGQTQNLRAWEKMVFARDLFLKYIISDSRSARRLLEEALAIDPRYTGAMAQLGLAHWIDARFGFSPDRERSLRLAEEQAETALKLNPELGTAYMLKGGVRLPAGST